MNNILNRLNKNKSGKFVATDFILNLIASAVTTGIAQLLIYPYLAKIYDPQEYGIILTIMGVGNTVINTLGNSLNNVRLMVNSNYEREGKKGDFLILAYSMGAIGFIAMLIYLLTFGQSFGIALILLSMFATIGILRSYGVVSYRLELNFKKNLICSIFIALGNIVGIVIIHTTGIKSLWPLIFVFGELFGIGVVMFTSKIFREPFVKTQLFRFTSRKVIILLITTLITSLLTYLDRLILLPLLGGEAVSVYSTAAFFGKCLSVVMTPMAAVLLGYYAQNDFIMTRKKFWVINATISIISLLFWLISLLLSKRITGLFYPTLIKDASPYLLIANLTSIIGTLGTMTQPAVLKYAPTYLQLVIQVGYCAIYLGGGLIGSNIDGLMGFSVAALIATVCRVIALYLIGHIALKSVVK